MRSKPGGLLKIEMETTPKSRIIQTAIKEFADNYYDTASINSIIKNSNTSKGTFYHYFKDKEDLYLQIIDIAVQEKMIYMEKKLNSILSNKSEILLFNDNFKSLIQAGIEFAVDHPLFSEMGMKMLQEPNSYMLDKVIDKYGYRTESFIDKLVDKAIENNEINPKLSRDFVVKIISFLLSNYIKLIPMEKKMDLKQITNSLDQLNEFFKNGINKVNNK